MHPLLTHFTLHTWGVENFQFEFPSNVWQGMFAVGCVFREKHACFGVGTQQFQSRRALRWSFQALHLTRESLTVDHDETDANAHWLPERFLSHMCQTSLESCAQLVRVYSGGVIIYPSLQQRERG